MKKRTLITGNIALLLLAAVSLSAAEQMTTYAARSGSKMRLEGTSNIHDWQVESPFIGGMLEVGAGFPTEPGQAVTPGPMPAKAEVFIQVRSLKSIEKDGKTVYVGVFSHWFVKGDGLEMPAPTAAEAAALARAARASVNWRKFTCSEARSIANNPATRIAAYATPVHFQR